MNKPQKTILTIAIITAFSVLFMTQARPSYAYWQVLGFKIPTNFGEFKTLVFVKNTPDTQKELEKRKQMADEYKEEMENQDEIPNNQQNEEKDKLQEENRVEFEEKMEKAKEAEEGTKPVDEDVAKKLQEMQKNSAGSRNGALPTLMGGLKVNEDGTIVIPADKVESLLNTALKGKTYFKYTVEDVSVSLSDGKGTVTLKLNGGKAIELEIVPNGNMLEITNVKDVGSSKLSFFENIALQQGIKSLPSLIDQFVPEEYASKVEGINITSEGITVKLSM